MNKFLQVLIGLCAGVWLIIGIMVLCFSISAMILFAKVKPFEKMEQFAPFMMQSGTGTPNQKQAAGSAYDLQKIMIQARTPEFQACARKVLGDEKINEMLKSGQIPSSADLAKLMSCLQ